MVSAIKERIANNLASLEARITAACLRSGRQRGQVTLLAVSKTRSNDEIWAAYQAGVRYFGENRIEELAIKAPWLADLWADEPPAWHMIGHLQSRKARDVVTYCGMLQTLDSLSLARKLDSLAAEYNRQLPVLLECNVSGEETKSGFAVSDEQSWEPLAAELAGLARFTHLDVLGLMTMAPQTDIPDTVRLVFTKLRRFQDFLRRAVPQFSWDELSMGMSNDFEVAIEEGATMVRIGRAIFTENEMEH